MGMLMRRHNIASNITVNNQPKVQSEMVVPKVETVEEKVSTKKIKKSAK